MNRLSLAAKCCLRGVLAALAVGLLVVGAARMAGASMAATIAGIVTATLVVFALHGAWRMAEALETFARAVPAQPDVRARPSGRARLRWPALNLEVRGRAGVMREPDLAVEAGGEPMEASVDEAELLARESLQRLGVEAPEAEAGDQRLRADA